ncbi:AbrB/MazE/SpoVT family DNA-binding domain-containing protein [Salisediminibacterium halotolerans]|uniref:AbrB/MazE/SpoVT family DNA-binding domain-containing protein n=1 Tax=Salisediminibacterium halotolerans TaxID=517425 RepID=UPI000EB34D6C|nr:hypothetical protein [Salisediminibacterium halotolerans]RLJ72194.1 antitoxin component of MazEF toxin-antitoxin module [Actinophytocola xinjiangensis]RPE85407.1 antitoxin component of MazEF toxin-antitoxin module [Salisediminibacterium halotolerans]TWG33364.1 antitoxin component of MazEF toxin-antitoxin module [Salisediminibacterium halotolerans]GEL07107.1 hypothetical protein SHA02_05230 [Salisediminibacterium halotolerans]
MRTRLIKHGDSEVLVFPDSWKEGLNIDADTKLEVTVDEENRRLIVEPLNQEHKPYDIKDLAEIAKKQQQPAFEDSKPVGDEIL